MHTITLTVIYTTTVKGSCEKYLNRLILLRIEHVFPLLRSLTRRLEKKKAITLLLTNLIFYYENGSRYNGRRLRSQIKRLGAIAAHELLSPNEHLVLIGDTQPDKPLLAEQGFNAITLNMFIPKK